MKLIDQYSVLLDYWESIVELHNIRNNRESRNVMYRHAFFVACREYSNMSLKSIGRIVGRDHATVLHAQRVHKNNYMFNKTYREIYDSVSYVVSEKINRQTEEIEALMFKRLAKSDIKLYTDSMVIIYKKRLETEEQKHKNQVESLKNEIKILRKASKRNQERAEYLNEECLRLKNLL